MYSIPQFAEAIGGSVFVLLMMSVGSGIGEEIAKFLYGKSKGGIFQMIYMLVHLPVFIIGGYVYTLLGIPAASVISSALFFGLWGIFTVFVSRGFMAVLGKVIDFKPPGSDKVRGKELLDHLRGTGMPDEEIKPVLLNFCDSEKKVEGIINGKDVKVKGDSEALCYSLSKRGLSACEIISVLVKTFGFTPEEAGLVWRRASL